jgi:hypothetical protein
VLSVAERYTGEKMEGATTCVGGPRIDADFDSWHRVMRNKWAKMTELRSQTRGGNDGNKANAQQTRRRRQLKGKERRQKPGGRPRETETRGDPNPKMGQKGHGDRSGKPKARCIYIIEGARCSDTDEAMETSEVT